MSEKQRFWVSVVILIVGIGICAAFWPNCQPDERVMKNLWGGLECVQK